MNLNFFFRNFTQPTPPLNFSDAVFNSSLEPNKSTDFLANLTAITLIRSYGEDNILKNVKRLLNHCRGLKVLETKHLGHMTITKSEAQLMRCQSL